LLPVIKEFVGGIDSKFRSVLVLGFLFPNGCSHLIADRFDFSFGRFRPAEPAKYFQNRLLAFDPLADLFIKALRM
jgi:hypothetical protein